MKTSTGPVSNEDALKTCDAIEAIMARIFNGELKPGQMPIDPICRLIQFARDTVTSAPVDASGGSDKYSRLVAELQYRGASYGSKEGDRALLALYVNMDTYRLSGIRGSVDALLS